ncbi:hypothetical protein GCM10010082_08730 [Kushneria pakistanensis]|uniref:Uncharacterized protein n=1 Tax=Kushneria pakistanensis TaxID=1508770 RepID=A0ABQ3FD68_9GAMM|nr:hypothetical protein [Kushneria pakistanensis]GHC19374.1 hypothetical protein GCM10010082_08730 [Kushneria pakistanensis]
MTRRKKTRSLADKVTIRTGKRKDYRRWRHDNPDQLQSTPRFAAKKRNQRKAQAASKLERQRREATTLPLTPQGSDATTDSSQDS